jgi:hypothetical protein
MAHSVMELIAVLANLASGGRRGKSCARPGAASRVAVWELLVWSPSVRRLEGWADEGPQAAQRQAWKLLTVKFRQPSHEFTFCVGMNFISYPLLLTPMV